MRALENVNEEFVQLKKRLIELVIEKSYKYDENPIFKLSCGRMSNYYVDCKPLMYNNEAMKIISKLINQYLLSIDDKVDCIGGPETGAIPLSICTAMNNKNINTFYVRKQSKDHGTKKMVEGDIKEGDNVIIIEDVITTGESTINSINRINEFGATVIGLIVLINREEADIQNTILNKYNIPYMKSILRISEIKNYDSNKKMNNYTKLEKFVKDRVRYDDSWCSDFCNFNNGAGDCLLFGTPKNHIKNHRYQECIDIFKK